MSEVRIKLTTAQRTALETAGVFEEPRDEEEQWLCAAIRDDYIVTRDPQRLWRVMFNMSNDADDYAEGRGPPLDADARRMYRADRDVFSRLARRSMYLERALSLKSEMREWLPHVALWEVKSLEDMRECRRIVPALSSGAYRDVTAEEMFAALKGLRRERPWCAREAECRNAAEAMLQRRAGRLPQRSASESPIVNTNPGAVDRRPQEDEDCIDAGPRV